MKVVPAEFVDELERREKERKKKEIEKERYNTPKERIRRDKKSKH